VNLDYPLEIYSFVGASLLAIFTGIIASKLAPAVSSGTNGLFG
jgi:hypothetical protein